MQNAETIRAQRDAEYMTASIVPTNLTFLHLPLTSIRRPYMTPALWLNFRYSYVELRLERFKLGIGMTHNQFIMSRL